MQSRVIIKVDRSCVSEPFVSASISSAIKLIEQWKSAEKSMLKFIEVTVANPESEQLGMPSKCV
jgi:hypothetical protein